MFPSIPISTRAAQALKKGYLWVFSNEITTKKPPVKPGEWVQFIAGSELVGIGYYNPHSLIAGRMVTTGASTDIEQILKRRLQSAFFRRKKWTAADSFRAVFSEADFLPGLIIDNYSGVLVLQSSTAGIDTVLPVLEKLVPAVFKDVFGVEPKGFVVRGDAGVRRLEGIENFTRVVIGTEEELSDGLFTLDGLKHAANFVSGQKTGFFLDQRNNRARFGVLIGELKNATVLDLFSHSGAWGLAALKAGAKHVTFVDESKEALALAYKSVELNGFSSDRATFVASEVFAYLENTTTLFDVVVTDPPAFVKSKKVLTQAVRAYEKVNRLAWSRIKDGGFLFASSCSYHLAEQDFVQLLQMATRRPAEAAQIIYRGGQSEDHPILLMMPETQYLKCTGLERRRLEC